MRHFITIAGMGFALLGCDTTGLNAEDDSLCQAQLGQPCTSIQQADKGSRLQPYRTFKETQRDVQAGQLSQDKLPVASTKSKTAARTAAAGAPNGGAPYHVASYRVPERLGTLWLAPRLDDAGIFHEATYVHFVVRGASWGKR